MKNKYLKILLSSKMLVFVQFLVSCVFIYMLNKLAIFPDKFMIGIIIIILALCAITYVLQFKSKEKSIRSIISKVLATLLSILLIFASVQIYKGTSFINGFSGANFETRAMSVIVLKDSNYLKIEQLNDKVIGKNSTIDRENTKNALEELNSKISNVSYNDYSNWKELGNALYNEEVDAILMNESFRAMIEEEYPEFESETRVIYQVEIKVKTEDIANHGSVDDGVFNILVTGIDTYGPVSTKSRSDVNMIVTVNMNTHKILMTGIPRDYYVKLDSIGEYDKLTHSGIYGINETVNTISNLLDVDIDYYFRINFSSLINIVDVLGGIDVYSDQYLNLGGIEIQQGMNHMNGEMALRFARERYSYLPGDNHRIQNQQAVMMAIIDKLTSSAVITNYQSVLEGVDGTFETNMSSDDLMSVIKAQLSDMQGYEMINQYLSGTGNMTYGLYSMPDYYLYTMIPNEESVKQANTQINQIMNEK